LACWEKDVFGRKRRKPQRHKGTKVLCRSNFLNDKKEKLPQRHRGTAKNVDRRNFFEHAKKELPQRHKGTKVLTGEILFLFKIVLL
jgi:hypothetical protein